MAGDDQLAQRFEQHRPRLRAVAYRMLGSVSDAEDAVQNAWLPLSRAEPGDIGNLGGWLTTVVAREALHLLRSRRRRREELGDTPLPDPVVSADGDDPEQKALLADSVSLALLVVLESLSPAERLAFVLHDMFEVPFDEVAPLVDRTPAAARQLASRARRRVRGAAPPAPDEDDARQRAVVDAFFAAAAGGDFAELVRLLDPDVVFRADYGGRRRPAVYRGAEHIARQSGASRGAEIHPVLVNGLPGVVTARSGRPVSIMAFTVVGGRIVEIDGIRDAERVQRLTAGVVRFRW
ncbi:sigma-70 family RNA polymerase sigma factor [Saccharopolyspora sp. TS4A08]|uniref:Sigma-70 family RNA polymerase sigma factor n=1 Tax=Saccharopolyspora ipomoeae TaxID=3042027 RepID=A0ABT6PMT9_9PSEU|nr:sigma-70 family RNA polymerase sigma factor [Saccharopolyspora sp. TS4A08]MDI2029327.1 sigma-70 family RNA polymerase sigma factor [Saccharopolyspora sp. TS4A08]